MNKWAKEVHENAVAHGWWESKRELDELLALIHSEWSEALEADRNNEPLVWNKDGKPEGIAVELIDGCIRILDFAAHEGLKLTNYRIENNEAESLSVFVNGLHYQTSVVCNSISKYGEWLDDSEKKTAANWLSSAVNEVFRWIRHRGINPIQIMMEKHEYNKTRPYKHGKKF